MTNLQQLQQQLQDYILQQSAQIPHHINGNPTIYQDAYHLRLIEVLQQDYPALQQWLGEAQFWQLGSDYLNAHPSTGTSVRGLGEKLPHFLMTHSSDSTKPLSAELAQFEWALLNTFDAADDTILTANDIARIPAESWPNMRLSLHASCQCVNFTYNIGPFWHALTTDSSATAPSNPEPMTWLFWRQNLEPSFRALSEPDAIVLQQIANGASFAEICEALCQCVAEESVAQCAAQSLQTLVQAECLHQVSWD